jgi:argininosuccinate lyase
VVGGAVAYAIQKGKDLSECTLQEMHAFDRRIEADVFDILSLEGSVSAKDVIGGTAPEQVRRQIADCRKLIK